MRIYVAEIETRRSRTVRLAAGSADAAARSAAVLLNPGDRLVRVDPLAERTPASAIAALRLLCGRDFLDLDMNGWTVTANVRDWIDEAATSPARADALNPSLALAGLRVTEDSLIVGTPRSVPLLAEWFQGTAWAGGALVQTLLELPGACRTSRTFGGVAARAVALPLLHLKELDRL